MPVVDYQLINSQGQLGFDLIKGRLGQMLPRLKQQSHIVQRREGFGNGVGMRVEIVQGNWHKRIDKCEGGEAELLDLGGGQNEEAADQRRPDLGQPVEIQPEHLLNPFKSEYLLGLLNVGIFQTLIGGLDQRLQHGLQIRLVVGGTLHKNGVHAGVEYLDVAVALVRLGSKVAIVVERIVFEGLPKGDPAGGAEEI